MALNFARFAHKISGCSGSQVSVCSGSQVSVCSGSQVFTEKSLRDFFGRCPPPRASRFAFH
ncbi:hypothetical protein [Methanimicrococcus hongohii]|uniref:hypothetical protein n=1 Tax=Methanimicrococcus hongohii TaxID=3028295 RepID=UPI00293098A9|nr:hypothetical protein [Methanimicrococcus sp. Hf6]